MKVEFLVLYVKDVEQSKEFWTQKVGMVVKNSIDTGDVKVYSVGFEDQYFSFQLIDLSLMKDNPDNLNLGSSSIMFKVENLKQVHKKFVENNVEVSDINEYQGITNFTLFDNEGNGYAVS